jgi:Cu2+-exporting ATPase
MNAATLVVDDTSHPSSATATSAAGVLDDPLEQASFTRWTAGAAGERLGESSLQLSGMHCAACAGLVEAALLAVPGVHAVTVAAASQRACVTWDPARVQPSAMVAALRRAGYDAVPDAAAPARALRQREARQALWRLFVAAFCAMQVMMLATPNYVAAPGELTGDMLRLLNWGSWVLTLPVLAFSCGPFFRGAWRSLRARRIGMDVPVALGIVITFVASTGAAFQPDGLFGGEVYFDSLTMFVSFLLGARWLEMRARHRAAEEMEAHLARLPETAERLSDDDHVETVSVLRLRAGDRVRVPLGQAFPADGELLQGEALCDESLLTGESLPVKRSAGGSVIAGSLNVGAPVVMRVQRVGPDTRFAGILAMMRSAATQRPALARSADRWAGPFLWTVLLLAAGGAAVWSVLDPARALWVAVSVLIVTCPCALSLAAPATLLAAARGLARRGVMVQRLDAIEALARVDQVFFDKTGTLTGELPQLAGVALWQAASERRVDETQALAAAAALAAWSQHPLSRALVAAVPGQAPTGLRLRDPQEQAGQGVRAHDEQGREWRLGAAPWVAPWVSQQPAGEDEAQVWLGVDGQPWASFVFEEALRPGAAEAVSALQGQGLRVTLLSGDTKARAQGLARRLGIEEVIAQATPADKLAAVVAAQALGRRVAMVGDGVNDAPVLARADVALAMGHGALVARGQADAVLTAGRPMDVAAARTTARRALRIVHQNLAWAALYNLTCVPLALAGWLPPWAAGLGMATSSLLVVGNALRAGR